MTTLISLSRAFAWCLSTSSYNTWLVISIVTFAAGLYFLIKYTKKNGGGIGVGIAVAVLAIILLAGIFLRPVDIALNTTSEQADRGVYIGY